MQTPLKPIRTLEDLTAAWTVIDGGFGYSAPQIFILVIEVDGTITPTIIQIYDAEIGGEPEGALLASMVERLAEVIDLQAPDGSVAVMKARPGPATLTRLDQRWLRELHAHLVSAPFSSHRLFFACDVGVGPVPPDELLGATA
ncbi:hypothetical protein [Aeromicrobium sp. CF3.5]|uniref:hypothetical protein n=1 Tax=Aeromicrobium sp. CF3.5 TaxID=3373078 RepID=UPI003EE6B884